jgi:hypothetical protein
MSVHYRLPRGRTVVDANIKTIRAQFEGEA